MWEFLIRLKVVRQVLIKAKVKAIIGTVGRFYPYAKGAYSRARSTKLCVYG